MPLPPVNAPRYGVDVSNLDPDAVQFLHTLYAPYQNVCFIDFARLFVNSRLLPLQSGSPTVNHYYGIGSPGLLTFARNAMGQRNGNSVYMGVLPRTRQAGDSSALGPCAWLWVDLDGGNQTALDALQLLRKLDYNVFPAPTMLVGSGGGIHAYWQLKHVESVGSQAEQARLSNVLKRLVAHIGGPLEGAHACPASTDCARILRLPGTYNHKTGTPRRVKLLRCEPEKSERRSLDWWDGNLPALRVYTPKTRPGKHQFEPGSIPPSVQAQIAAWEPAGTRHYRMTDLARCLCGYGWDERQVWAALETKADACGVPSGTTHEQAHIKSIVDWVFAHVQPD